MVFLRNCILIINLSCSLISKYFYIKLYFLLPKLKISFTAVRTIPVRPELAWPALG